jgi:hypothetical protein
MTGGGRGTSGHALPDRRHPAGIMIMSRQGRMLAVRKNVQLLTGTSASKRWR